MCIRDSIYVLLFVTLGFVLFDADSVRSAAASVCAMFGGGGLPLAGQESLYALRSGAVLLLSAAVGATPLPRRLITAVQQKQAGRCLLYTSSRGELNSIGSSSTALDSLGCSLSAEIGMTLLTDIGAVSGFSTVCVAGGRAVFSCFGGSGMTGFTSGGVGTGDVLGVTLDATGNGGSG